MSTRDRANPFPGLRPFAQEEADLFFGRDRQSDELVRRLAGKRFLAVVGTSGSGKSSLVRAGLLPSLEGGFMAGAGAHWRIATLRPQDDPVGFLAKAIVETGMLAHLDLDQSPAEGVVETTLRRSSLGLVEAARLARLAPHENLLILVDQFEELFRFAGLARQRDDSQAFVKLLLHAASQSELPIYVVITMRSDFLGDCDRFRGLPEAISDSQYLIPRLTRDELQAVITGPIGVRGGRIAPSLVQRLLNEVGDDMDQLPVLQHALMRAWDHWERHDPDNRPIGLDNLEGIGGMAEALSRHADEAFDSLASDRDRKTTERLFKCLTERGTDNREIRRPTPLSRIAAIANAPAADVVRVINMFRAPLRAFLMPPHGITLDGTSVIDISHESLIRQWKRLRAWVDEEAESRATYLRLVEAARLRRAGRAGLWGEPDLTFARQWQEREAPSLAWAERYASGFDEVHVFLADSEAAHAAELERERQRAEAELVAKERELQQAKALAEAQRQRVNEQEAAGIRQRRLIWGLAALLVAALCAVVFGLYQKNLAQIGLLAAQSALRDAIAGRLEMQSRAILEGQRGENLDIALLLSAAAFRLKPNNEAYAQLQNSLTMTPRLLKAVGFSDPPTELSDDGRTVVTATTKSDGLIDGEAVVHLWDAATGRHRADLTSNFKFVPAIAISPDGKSVASGSAGGDVGGGHSLRLWDLASGRPISEAREVKPVQDLKGVIRGTPTIAFSPDGKVLVSVGIDRSLHLWDAVSLQERSPPLLGHTGQVTSVAFSRDNKILASTGDDRTLRLWEVSSGRFLGAMQADESMAVSDASRSQDQVFANLGSSSILVFSPDGRTIVSGNKDGMRLWDVAGRRARGPPLKEDARTVTSFAFSPDGNAIVSGGSDGTLRLWDVASGRQTGTPLQAHRGPVRGVAFSADQTLVTVGDNTLRHWDSSTWQILSTTSQRHVGEVTDVAFSSDSKTVVSAGQDGGLRLWDVANGQQRGDALPGYASNLTVAAFVSDDNTLEALSGDGSLKSWDVHRLAPRDAPHGGMLRVDLTEVTHAALSPDGTTVVLGASNGSLRVLESRTGRPRCEAHHAGKLAVLSVAYSRDSKTIVSAHWHNVLQWDATTCKQRGPTLRVDAGLGALSSVAISPDGGTVAATDFDSLFLWDALSGELRARLESEKHLSRVAFSPDGKMVVSGSNDGSIRLWDAASRQPVGVSVQVSEATLTSVAFSPNGKSIASGSRDGTVRVSDAPNGWIDRVCTKLVRNLSEAEWSRYVGDIAYVTQCPELPVPMD